MASISFNSLQNNVIWCLTHYIGVYTSLDIIKNNCFSPVTGVIFHCTSANYSFTCECHFSHANETNEICLKSHVNRMFSHVIGFFLKKEKKTLLKVNILKKTNNVICELEISTCDGHFPHIKKSSHFTVCTVELHTFIHYFHFVACWIECIRVHLLSGNFSKDIVQNMCP